MRTRSSLKLEGKIKASTRKKSLKSLKAKRLENEADSLGISVSELKRRRAHDIETQGRVQHSRRKLRVIPGASSLAA